MVDKLNKSESASSNNIDCKFIIFSFAKKNEKEMYIKKYIYKITKKI